MFLMSLSHIGVDVGGISTDAVLIEGSQIIAQCKIETGVDITTKLIQTISIINFILGVFYD